jgi:hypothetical protein
MKIFGGELTQDQIEAGLRVMRGKFDTVKVSRALRDAGVTNNFSGAERLISRELRLRNIRRVDGGGYERCNG